MNGLNMELILGKELIKKHEEIGVWTSDNSMCCLKRKERKNPHVYG